MRGPSFRRVGLVALDDEKAISSGSELVELVIEVAFAQPVPFYLSRADGLDAPAPEGLFDEGPKDAGASPVQRFLSQALHLVGRRRHAAQPQALAAFLLTLVVPAWCARGERATWAFGGGLGAAAGAAADAGAATG